jgi:hypothetical protein
MTSRTHLGALVLSVCVLLAGGGHAQTLNPAEEAMYQTAQTSGLPADFLAYLERYPDGAFAEAARFELEVAGVAVPPPPQTDITFTTPLTAGVDGVAGRSLADLLAATPLYPPIEGLPDEAWKDQPCTACHQWTVMDLCEQGKTLNRPEMDSRLDLPHPYGPAFKRALRTFAQGGCRIE